MKEAIEGKIMKERELLKRNNLLERCLVDRQFYMRARMLSINDKKGAKTLERYEQQMRSGQEQRKKAQHKDFLQALNIHYRDFWDFHKKKQQTLKKRAGQAKAYLDTLEKKEQHDYDKQERERIRLLKANDLEGYEITVRKEKNSRLSEILDQTQKYLEQIGAKVIKQKREALLLSKKKKEDEQIEANKGMPMIKGGEEHIESNNEEEEEQPNNEIPQNESDKIRQDLQNSSKTYYLITHTITEDVKEDPKTLQGGKLKGYQLQGLQWLVSLHNNNLNGILADEMGLGKTIQTIALFCYLMEKKNNDGPFLIVVPLSTVTNWVLEFDKWAPHIKKMTYKGDPSTRKLLLYQMRSEKFNVVITTYDYIIKDKTSLNKVAWQYIIVDEGHRMKNFKCKFAQVLGLHYQSAHRLLLTGTPLQNNLTELWALMNFLLPKIFYSCDDFEKWFNRPFSKFGAEKNELLNEEERLLIINRLHQVLRPFLLRRMKKEVEQELPSKTEYVIKVELSAWQKIVYKQLFDHGTLARDPSTGKIGTRSLMNTMMQLRKICNHPYLFLQDYNSQFLIDNIIRSSGKFELLDRILPKLVMNGHKVLIFSQMTQLMDIMQLYFNIKGLKHLRLDGTTKAELRGECTHLFSRENSDYNIFLLSTRAGGQGLNLQAADTVIIFDSDFNPQIDLQAQDRAHRIGQKHEVRVYRLVTTTKVEEDIISRAAMKKNIDNVVIQAGLFNQKASDSDRRKKLEDLLRQDEKGEEEEEEDSVPDDEQINDLIARTDEEKQKYQQIDQERYLRENRDEIIKEMQKKLNLETLPKNINYRLMQDYEVPVWVKSIPAPDEKKETISGKRVRKKINYADDITEKQWEKCIEEGKDPTEEMERIKREKAERKKRKEEEEPNGPLIEEEEGESLEENKSGEEKEVMTIKMHFPGDMRNFIKEDDSNNSVINEQEEDEDELSIITFFYVLVDSEGKEGVESDNVSIDKRMVQIELNNEENKKQ